VPGSLPAAQRRQVEHVLAALRDVLDADLVGAYLHGSAALGGLRPHSDVDVFAVSRRPTTHAEKQRLVDKLLAFSGRRAPTPARPVELTIVVAAEIRPWHPPAHFDFQYGEWLRDAFESGNVEPWPTTTSADLAVLIAMVLLGDRPLLGPPPARLLDPVPPSDLVDAMVGSLDGLLQDLEGDTRNVVLTLARIWCTVATGAIRSKDGAATWALARLPDEHRQVLVRARSIYLGEQDDRWDDVAASLRPHVDRVVGEIRRVTGEAAWNVGAG
jgi:streptomycin 3"-adenylyltransferase